MSHFISLHAAPVLCSSTLSSSSVIAQTKLFNPSVNSVAAAFPNSLQWIVSTPLISSQIHTRQSSSLSKQSISVNACFDPAKWEGPGRRKPVEELYSILVEKNISQERQQELRVERWDKWESGRCAFKHEWKVDELVYIVKGSVRVTPIGSVTSAYFYAGDFIRYPKWLSAVLDFEGLYEQKYRFVAYGDE
ncbi:hypothetical protein O6H91_10G027300 [Diphasiastrum complanatum]|uniref:Uncharacterized protein n=1 Tax=Diphasiastrum complanatum TaxID=34168 RepID=A0ACC2CFE3_DIPCM|nr:hypothetical protein O6H91_10G027300 [Diphasiastrum complanatum]